MYAVLMLNCEVAHPFKGFILINLVQLFSNFRNFFAATVSI